MNITDYKDAVKKHIQEGKADDAFLTSVAECVLIVSESYDSEKVIPIHVALWGPLVECPECGSLNSEGLDAVALFRIVFLLLVASCAAAGIINASHEHSELP